VGTHVYVSLSACVSEMPKRKKTRSLLSHGSEEFEVEVGRVEELAEESVEIEDEVENGRSTEEENEVEGEAGEGGGDVSVGRGGGGGGEGGKKTRIAGLYQPPTHDELRTLKETQNLYQSNLMRLQITELLSEVKPSSSCGRLEEILTSLRTTLMSLPSTSTVDLCDAVQSLPPKVHYPINLDPSSVKGKFIFRPPLAVKVVGSYLLKTAIKPDLNVDLALQIPPECLQAKDHLNYRYLHKRALYLCHVAASLRRKKAACGVQKIRFGVSHGGPLLPILHLTPDG
jgi:U3 small nucleolar RNA-associated protein 22